MPVFLAKNLGPLPVRRPRFLQASVLRHAPAINYSFGPGFCTRTRPPEECLRCRRRIRRPLTRGVGAVAARLPSSCRKTRVSRSWRSTGHCQPVTKRQSCGRGDAKRRRLAVQLCTLRNYGRFLPEAIASFFATVLVPSPCSTLTSRFFASARCPTLAMNACWSDPSSTHSAQVR